MITIGTAIIYTLSAADAEAINRRRTNGGSIAERMKMCIAAQRPIPGTFARA
jgi:hypothetical protein